MFNIVNRKIGHHQRSIIISAEVQITRGVWHRLDQSTHGGRRNGNISLVLVVVMHRPTVHHGYSFIFKYSQDIQIPVTRHETQMEYFAGHILPRFTNKYTRITEFQGRRIKVNCALISSVEIL